MAFEDILTPVDTHAERTAQRAVVRGKIVQSMGEVLHRVGTDESTRKSSIPMKSGRPCLGLKGQKDVHDEEGCVINIRRYPKLGRASIWLTRPDQLLIGRPLGTSCDYGVPDGQECDSFAALVAEIDQRAGIPARLTGITCFSSLIPIITDPAAGCARNYPAESFAAACISACLKESDELQPGSCGLPDNQSLLLS